MSTDFLTIQNLSVSIAGKQILKNISLSILPGSAHVLMGQNGSGKTTLARTIAGDPNCHVQQGDIFLSGVSILNFSPDFRAQKGIFLAFQHPPAIPGLTVFSFLRESYNARFSEVIGAEEFRDLLFANMDLLGIDQAFAFRDLNDGFSGGEKKRLELLQLFIVKPNIAILDEIDSGLDADAQKLFVQAIAAYKKAHQRSSFLFISHNQQFMQQICPDHVHIFKNGSLVSSGTADHLEKIQQDGYESCF